MSDTAAAPAQTVTRRHVLYLSGFDPQGARHYHRLYRDQAQRQVAHEQYTLAVGPRERMPHGVAAWELRWAPAGDPSHRVVSTYEFMAWDDIIRAHWSGSWLRVAWMSVHTNAVFQRAGVSSAIRSMSWPAYLAAVVPLALVLTLFMLAAGSLAWLVAGLWRGTAGWGMAAAVATLWFGAATVARAAERRLHMRWLTQAYNFTRRQACGQATDLDARVEQLAARLRTVLRDSPADEVLVVGHSLGASVAVQIVARAWTQGAADLPATRWDRLSLLTLGHSIPALALLPPAIQMRADLVATARATAGRWVDVTAPPDGSCIALVDPVDPLGNTVPADVPRPKLLSPRFFKLFTPEHYRHIRRDKFRCHFQYLMASDLPGDYDYFAITAGPQRLAQRFASHPSVKGFRPPGLFTRR